MGIVGTWKTSYAGYKAGNSVAAGAATGLKAAEGYFAYEGHDACTAWSAGAGAVSNALCIKASDPACMLYNGIFSAIGNAKQVRKDTELETMQEAAMRLEYALAPPARNHLCSRRRPSSKAPGTSSSKPPQAMYTGARPGLLVFAVPPFRSCGFLHLQRMTFRTATPLSGRSAS